MKPTAPQPSAARYDEMSDAAGEPRPHWRSFVSRLRSLSPEALARRARFVQETIAADGVTFTVNADDAPASRPWELDLLPFIVAADEWAHISAAIAQRARLLDLLLRDLYGPQQMLAEGLVPPAPIFGQRDFLWPAHGVVPPGGVFLHGYAADLARSPDGRWWVISDRTRAPYGAGYALQNRLTLGRTFPDAFRDLHVQPLTPFFTALSDGIHRLSPSRGEEPLAVLLTPGPFNEAYFEHAFLARSLGFPLVEGQDLLVRGDAVYLKTLRGLRRVHAILRRLDDDFCDPVELRADSALGVPGLLHAMRAGTVLVANALGSAVLETAGLAGFLPPLAERLLGEPLAMPSIATWWCGEPAALDHVTKNLADLVVKPTYASIHMKPVHGRSLDAAGRARLIAGMQAQPHAYVAQEWLSLSHAPTWGREDGRARDDGRAAALDARAISMRVFAAATGDGSYVVMPGALARVAPHEGDVTSMQWGGSSKDTWVLTGAVDAARVVVAEDTQTSATALARPRLLAADVVKFGVEIASRVGENLFWMGRYAERCEGIARLLRAALIRLAEATPEAASGLASIGVACEKLRILPPAPSGKALDFVAAVVDPELAGGLAANVQRLHMAANQVRERMSTDNWHVVNRLPQHLPGKHALLEGALESLDEIMLSCVSLAGFAMDDMTRDESWQFLLLGRRLERLAHLAGVVVAVLGLPASERADALGWLLEAANSSVTYRARYRREPELLPVLHLVVLDETNPHAVAFQLRQLSVVLERLAGDLGEGVSFARLGPLLGALRAVPLEGFEHDFGPELEAACAALWGAVKRAEVEAGTISDETHRRFFTHAGTPAGTQGTQRARRTDHPGERA